MQCIVLRCIVLRHDMTCCIVLCCAVSYCIIIASVTPGLSTGKTVWSTAPVSWSGQRRLHGQEGSMPIPESTSVHRSLYTSQPSWCSFQGVTCGSVSGSSSYASVLSIVLDRNSLTGSIPASIGALTGLTMLDLAVNSLRGSIPASIGSLVNLQYLLLDHNLLTGTIPLSLSVR